MKSKRFSTYLILILVIVLIGALVTGFVISSDLSDDSKAVNLLKSGKEATNHVMVILDDSYRDYGLALQSGIEEAADSHRIAVEIKWVNSTDYEEEIFSLLDMAYYADIDGVILQAFADERLVENINRLSEVGIPVITLNEDLSNSQRLCYVGVNRYTLGQTVANLFGEAIDEKGGIAVIGSHEYGYGNESDMLYVGMKDQMKMDENLEITLSGYTEQGVISAETVALDIIKSHPEIKGIYCTDENNTLGVAQALIDNNVVGDYVVIGSGTGDELLDYLENGKIIAHLVVTDYEEIGRKAIEIFYESRNTYYVTSYIDTKVTVLNPESVTEFKRTMEKLDE